LSGGLKQKLRRRLLGRRFQQQIQDDHNALRHLGNLFYQAEENNLFAPGFDPSINEFEFSVYSQNGEDGVILSLLSMINVDEHYVVEIGTGDGRECNSANLTLNFGWRGCLFEANDESANSARSYFAGCLGKNSDRVRVFNALVSPENINRLLSNAEIPTQADVLSIDIDSYDYWVWEAIDTIIPKLVVIEYNASFGPTRSVTIPYGSMGKSDTQGLEYYCGASISALNRLAERKGYVLLGCDSKGINAFFVRSDLVMNAGIKAVTPEQAFKPHFYRTKAYTQERQCQLLSDVPLDEI
jgi:hypothetical protein